MSAHLPVELRRLVTERANNRCEYCGLSQEGQEAAFHVDHVRPVFAGGLTVADNLALACVSCSLRKAARQEAMDPVEGTRVPLFNPRQNSWPDHFRWEDFSVIGRTAIGRATIEALQMNRPLIVAIRQEEAVLGRHPPPRPSPVRITPP